VTDGSPGQRRPPPTWGRWQEIPGVCLHSAHLKQTLAVAILVGTVLFLINQLDVVAGGHSTGITWLKVGLTYLVPFCVSNYGILVASRRPRTIGTDPA
jgi:hypothetical protein